MENLPFQGLIFPLKFPFIEDFPLPQATSDCGIYGSAVLAQSVLPCAKVRGWRAREIPQGKMEGWGKSMGNL